MQLAIVKKKTTNTAKKVQDILYNEVDNEALAYGRENKKNAKKALVHYLNKKWQRSDL